MNMPKRNKDFPDRLSLDVTSDMRIHLIAIGYMMQAGGEYATPARNFISASIRDYVAKLTTRERQEFDEILNNVRLRETKFLPSEMETKKDPVV